MFPSEKPQERCLQTGAQCLSLRECLALLLGNGSRFDLDLAHEILARPGKGLEPPEELRAFFTALEVSGLDYLKEISSLSPKDQSRILAAFEIGRRYSHFRTQTLPKRRKSYSLSSLAQTALQRVSAKARSEPQEWLGFVPIHRTGEIGQLCLVEKGCRTHINIDPVELFARILILRPVGFILFHNHPSGTLTPSIQDLDLTERIGEISSQFDLPLLGHWIVTFQSEYWISPLGPKTQRI